MNEDENRLSKNERKVKERLIGLFEDSSFIQRNH